MSYNTIIDDIRKTNNNAGKELFILSYLNLSETIQCPLGNVPEKPVDVDYEILKTQVVINTRSYIKNIDSKNNNFTLSFFNKENPSDIIVTFKVPGIENELKFIKFLGIYDLEVSGDVEIKNDNLIAFISDDPKMPLINLKIDLEGSPDDKLKLQYTLNYDVQYKYNGITYRFTDKYESKEIIQNSNNYSITWDNVFQGGDLKIKWSYQNQSGEKNILIRGKNPEINTIKQYGKTVGTDKYWFFWDIMKQESSNTQFNKAGDYFTINSSKVYDASSHRAEQKGLPIWGGPRGFGLKQLDHWQYGGVSKECNAKQRWDWKENIKGGLEVLESKISEMKGSPHLTKIKSQIVGKEENLIMDDFTTGRITFMLANSGFFSDWDVQKDISDDKKSFLDANFITLYNGKGHIISKIEEVKEVITDKETNSEIEVTKYKIIIDDTKTGYLNDVLE